MRRLVPRIVAPSAPVLDRLVTAGVLVFTVVAAALTPSTRDLPALVGAVLVGTSVALRRARPALGIAVAVLVQAGDAAIGGDLAVSTATLVAMLVLSYGLGRHAGERELALGAAALLVAALVNAALATDGFLNELAFGVVIVGLLPIAGGRVLRRRAELVAELRAQRSELQDQREHRAREAVVAERVRVARELHDVVVHDVSAMVVQAAAARLVVHTQPADAVHAIARVEGAGREALDELRRALGVLRTDDRALALEPQPSLARLPSLAAVVAADGVALELDLAPGLDGLPPDLQLAAYRIVQDVLAGPPEVRGTATAGVARDRGELVVVVRHGGPPPVPGALVATRERVALFGGALDVEPAAGGGSRVCARLPIPLP